jgi:hypothetical protein
MPHAPACLPWAPAREDSRGWKAVSAAGVPSVARVLGADSQTTGLKRVWLARRSDLGYFASGGGRGLAVVAVAAEGRLAPRRARHAASPDLSATRPALGRPRAKKVTGRDTARRGWRCRSGRRWGLLQRGFVQGR